MNADESSGGERRNHQDERDKKLRPQSKIGDSQVHGDTKYATPRVRGVFQYEKDRKSLRLAQ